MCPTRGFVYRNNFYPQNHCTSRRCNQPHDLIDINTRIDLGHPHHHHTHSHCHSHHHNSHNRTFCNHNQTWNHNSHNAKFCTHNQTRNQNENCNHINSRQQLTNNTPIDNSNTTYINNTPTNAIGLNNENNNLLGQFHRDLYHTQSDHRWGNRTERQIRALRDLLDNYCDLNQVEMDDLRWGPDQRFELVMDTLRRRAAGNGMLNGFAGGPRYGTWEQLMGPIANDRIGMLATGWTNLSDPRLFH